MANFLHNQNKELLWGLLYELDIFNNIPDNHIQNIKNLFENELQNILKSTNLSNLSNLSNSPTLLDLNKIAIKQLPAKINRYKLMALDKKEIIKQSFSKRQEEFDNLINIKKPDLPNFLDSKDEPFDKNNMDLLLNDMIASREKTFSQIIKPVKNQNQNQNQSNNNQNNLTLQIGNTIHETDEILNIKKIVSFSNEITGNEITRNEELHLDIESIIKPDNILELTFLDKIKKTTLKENEKEKEKEIKEIKEIHIKIDELYSMLAKLGERLNRANIPE